MKDFIQFLANIFRFHKLKIFTVFASLLVMGFLLFPFDDLSDLVTAQVSQMSGRQVYLEFDHLGLSVWPSVGVKLENVLLDTPVVKDLKASSLSFSPSIAALLTLKAGVSVFLTDFIGGQLGLRFIGNSSLTNFDISGDYNFKADRIDLEQISDLLGLDFKFKGSLKGAGDLFFDAKLENPPKAEFQISVSALELLPAMIQVPNLGPMNIPGLRFEQSSLKGRFLPSDRGGTAQNMTQEFILEEFFLGSERDILSGKVRGKIDVRLQSIGGQLRPILGGYDFRVQLNAKENLPKEIQLILGFIDSHKKSSQSGDTYQFRVASTSMYAPPSLSTLPVFQ